MKNITTIIIIVAVVVVGLVLFKNYVDYNKEALTQECGKRFGKDYEYRRTEIGNTYVCLNRIEGDIKRF